MTTALMPFQGTRAEMILGEDREVVASLAAEIDGIASRLAGVKGVASKDEMGRLNDMLADARRAYQALEIDREARKKPILEEGRTLDALYRPARDAFEALEKAIKGHQRTFFKKEQEEAARLLAESTRLQAEAEEKRRKAIEAAQAADNEEARKAAEADASAASVALIEAHQARPLENVVTGIRSGNTNTFMRWKTVVTVRDIKLVPRDILEKALVDEAAKAASRGDDSLLVRVLKKMGDAACAVPGVEVTEEPEPVTRVGM